MVKHLRMGRVLFSLAMLSVLGFGSASIFATPTEAAVRGCTFRVCNSDCKAAGFSGGSCNYMDNSCDCHE